jgi:MFS family permease
VLSAGAHMFLEVKDRNIWLVNGAIATVGVAFGMALSILAVFLHGKGYTKGDIGALAAWSALGIVSFSLPMGTFIEKLSARRVLVASIAGYATTVTLFPYVADNFWQAAVVRFFDGAASVGIWVSCETIVLSRAEARHKAFVTTLYAISISIGYLVGPFLAKGVVAVATMETVFPVAGAISLVVAGVVLSRLEEDVKHVRRDAEAPTDLSAWALAWKVKTSAFGTFAYGYFQASVVLFLPLYLIESRNIEPEQTILIMAFFALGMLLFSNPAGRLGDRYGHLLMMRALALIGCFTVLVFVYLPEFWMMAIAVTIAGGTLAAISPISLALQGVIVEPHDYARSNAVYNAFYAAGMLLGPPISSRIFESVGGPAMLYHISAIWAAFVVFTIVFARDDPAARPQDTPEPASDAHA